MIVHVVSWCRRGRGTMRSDVTSQLTVGFSSTRIMVYRNGMMRTCIHSFQPNCPTMSLTSDPIRLNGGRDVLNTQAHAFHDSDSDNVSADVCGASLLPQSFSGLRVHPRVPVHSLTGQPCVVLVQIPSHTFPALVGN